ncbi:MULTISPECIES: hypothetical protein [unclassified Janthinobacterium]|uniref:hypothetical protein n=1 Tax=unclassified Janthinobacterium TaxID=2610881 RepID=UPI00036C5039|nr:MULTISPECIES: hypothetical protein [unclassified Janthinobacterium]MEC5159387.1 hypothetical protein [Janthinobacterium sp. CG_S6]
MTYSKVVSCYDSSANLEGRTIQALHSEYSFAALRLDNNDVISFSVEEVTVGKWFEVFPICLHALNRDCAFAWSELESPFAVTSSELLWREEWLEFASDTSSFMGSGPHSVQFANVLGTAPKSNINVVKVLAGVRLNGQNGRVLVVSSSDNTPFKIELATGKLEIEQVMQSHTPEKI